MLDGPIDRDLLDVAMTKFPPVDGSEWVPRRARRLHIYLDKKSLRVYDVGKRRLGISDAAISRVLKRVRRP